MPRRCICGRVRGQYYSDGRRAWVSGPAIPLGFTNSSFADAIVGQPDRGNGARFEAFVIPRECPTIDYIDKRGVNHGSERIEG